jgi:CRP/FNR family transcriptional regulator
MAEIEPRLLQVQALKAACSNCSVLELCLPIGLTGGEVERLA